MLPRLLPPVMLTAAAAILCAAVAGVSLGTVIGGFVVVTIILPPFIAADSAWTHRLSTLACCAATLAATWTCLLRAATVAQWLEISLLLFAYSAALAGFASLLIRLRFGSTLSPALTTILGLAWLTWPIWLSPAMEYSMSRATVNALVRFHPPLVANGILTFTPPWTEQSIAYNLTVLNQDVPITLPPTPWPSVVLHLLVGATGFAAGFVRQSPRPQKSELYS